MKRLILTLGISALLISCSNSKTTTMNNTQGPFYHVVFFWMNHPENTQEQEQLLSELERFMDRIPQPISKHIGKPAGTPREVVDNTYQFSLVLNFESKESQDEYQTDPIHLEFIDRAQHLWKKVQVYDSYSTTE